MSHEIVQGDHAAVPCVVSEHMVIVQPGQIGLHYLSDDVLLSIYYRLANLNTLTSALALQRACSRYRTLFLTRGRIPYLAIRDPKPGCPLLHHLQNHPACINTLAITSTTSSTPSTLQSYLSALLTIPSISLDMQSNSSQGLASISPLTNLHSLDLHHNGPLTPLSTLTPSIQHLAITSSTYDTNLHITSLTPLSTLTSLRTASFTSCTELKDFSPLSHSPFLTQLTTELCDSLDYSTLSSLTSLRQITFRRALHNPLPSLDFCATMPHLTSLDCDNCCKGTITLSPLIHVSALRHLNLDRFSGPATFDFAHISHLTTLTHLSLAIYSSRPPHPTLNSHHLSSLTSLARLELTNTGLPTLAPLSPLTYLTHLRIKTTSDDLSPLSSLTSLNYLWISNSPHVTSLAPLSPLIFLTTLLLHDCPAIASLAPLSPLTALTSLTLPDCPALYLSLNPLLPLTNLRALELTSNSPANGSNSDSDDGIRFDSDIPALYHGYTDPHIDATLLLDHPALRSLHIGYMPVFYANTPETRANYKAMRSRLSLIIP